MEYWKSVAGMIKSMKICRRISSAHDHRGIGVIGMCLTGALPIALMSDDCVVAPVIAQPSMPLFAFTPEGKRALGISLQELMTAVRRVQEKHLVFVELVAFLKRRLSAP
jgi:hypothetical protein